METKQYLGVKRVSATPMTWKDYEDYRGWLHEVRENEDGYLVEYHDGGEPNHKNHKGYISWSPAYVFDKAYSVVGELTFGEAIEALKTGMKVARKGWNGKGMYLTLISGYPVNGHLNASHVDSEVEGETQGKAGQMLPHIVMKTAGDSQCWGEGYSDYVPWLASQTDMLSDDWYIV